MANNLASNPWVLDTAAVTVLFPGHIIVNAFEWEGYALDTDTVVVKDGNGKEVWKANGFSDLTAAYSGAGSFSIQGLALTTLASGKLRVFFD